MVKKEYSKKVDKSTILSRRPPYLKNVILALILASLVMASIFYIGYLVSYNKYRAVLQSQEQLRYSLLSFEVEKGFLEDNCSKFDPFLFSAEMDDMGKTIGILEDRLGKSDKAVLEAKKTYSLLEARHLLYIKEHNQKCANRVNIIIFFYTNLDDGKDESEKLGFMLSSLKNSFPNLMIYSFDYNLDSSLIELLKEKYKITVPNKLVINEKTPINVFKKVEDIRTLLI